MGLIELVKLLQDCPDTGLVFPISVGIESVGIVGGNPPIDREVKEKDGFGASPGTSHGDCIIQEWERVRG